MKSKVLFLCTGNYYRSRFAEYLFNREAKQHGLNWHADSCGLALKSRRGQRWASSHPHTGTAAASRHRAWRRCTLSTPGSGERFEFVGTDHRTRSQRASADGGAAHSCLGRQDKIWDVEDVGFVPADQALGQIELQVAKLVERLSQ